MDTLRQSIHPAPGDTWATIAEAHLPDEDSAQAISQLQSWNPYFCPPHRSEARR